MHYQRTYTRHEVLVQRLRIERKSETQRLDKLKATLDAKLEAKLRHGIGKSTGARAA